MAEERPYHHGDLRRALLDASLQLIEASGPEALSLREVARRAGVSHAAPYRHFESKDELLECLSVEGFATMHQRMEAAKSGATSPLHALELTGVAYVELALEHPGHCAVMFGAIANDLKRRPLAKDAFHSCFERLLDLIRECQKAGEVPSGDPLPYAHIAWAAMHGIATLAIAGQLEKDDRELEREEVLEVARQAAATLSAGLRARSS